MLSSVLDVFRLRQYFDALARGREVLAGIGDDLGFLTDTRRALVRLPGDPAGPPPGSPFPPADPLPLPGLEGRRVGLLATGGSGALASLVGVARALEEAGATPSVISVCSGSALFGFPLAAGLPADEVAEFCLGLRPDRYVDVDWQALARVGPTGARGFIGLVRGERMEEVYRDLLGDMRLGQMPVPAYAPIWNIEENRTEYLGPLTHPEVTVARAVRMAVSLPLFIEPVELDGYHWCDGGIVDIFPVRPALDLERPPDVAVAVNGFYPPGFVGEDARGWQDRRASILYVASQVRTSQQVELARTNLGRLRRRCTVIPIEPVPYSKVRGVGFYRQFLSTRDWAEFMLAGRADARRALSGRYGPGRPDGAGQVGDFASARSGPDGVG
ncbi:MAG TPA: patatin-like phospholipase family protein [Acidimicrobiales bacterium]|nr:patatin-like phospholipase family protein [Acidimicrobiales bacterium]